MDIVVWLRSLGLGKYEPAFRENDIDETVLPGLTHETLKELGVASIGHRVKLLDAIAALRSDASGKPPSVDPMTKSSAPSAHPEDRAERRQVTVMFCDLVGSTALSARIDPEDLREVIAAYQTCVAETVQHFGGFVAKYMGDGVLIYSGQAATLMASLDYTTLTLIHCGKYALANARADEVVALADEKGSTFWKAMGIMNQGCVLALTGKASDAVHSITSGITAWRSTGARVFMPLYLSYLTRAYADLGRFDDAWRCIDEAITAVETTQERWWEADVHRIAGEIALLSPKPDVAKAEAYFERALAVARQQQAKSWELRASMSLARLWRDQGKVQQARELLAPVYGWFTEGFETRDLKEAKALLEQLAV
jgi:class 3 adenylate cyclase